MSGDVEIHYDADDLAKLLRKTSPEILQQPLTNFFDRAGNAVLNSAKIEAPVDTGRMRSSLGKGTTGGIWEQDKSQVPLWLKVGTNVNNQGFSYPFALDTDEKYHYRATRPDLQGQRTKGWFSGSLTRVKSQIRGFLQQLGSEIRAKWNE